MNDWTKECYIKIQLIVSENKIAFTPNSSKHNTLNSAHNALGTQTHKCAKEEEEENKVYVIYKKPIK